MWLVKDEDVDRQVASREKAAFKPFKAYQPLSGGERAVRARDPAGHRLCGYYCHCLRFRRNFTPGDIDHQYGLAALFAVLYCRAKSKHCNLDKQSGFLTLEKQPYFFRPWPRSKNL